MKEIGEHAVVLGAGMAGLVAAGALSEFYDSVTVVERDTLPDRPAHRRGIPQGRHVHMLLSRGSHVLGELFPGLPHELAAAGAVVIDDGDLSRVYVRSGPYELKQSGTLADPAALAVYLASRPFLEFHVRRRVAALANVNFLDGHNVVEPLAANDSILGVRIINRDNGVVTALDADLVVDATGRNACTPAFLEDLGYGRPPEERSAVNVGYSSQPLSIPEGCIVERLALFNRGIDRHRGLLMACEHDTWMLAIGRSAAAGRPPADLAEMLTLAAQSLPAPIMAGLRNAQPLGQSVILRNTAAIWRRFDQIPRFPSGLVVIGDALCSLDPSYGQGMTMATLQALTLRDCLNYGHRDVAQRFFHAAARQIGPTWTANQVRDRILAPVPKPRSMRQRAMRWSTQAALNATANDTVLAERFLRVLNLVDSSERLQDPRLLPRVLAANVRYRRTRPGAQTGSQWVEHPAALLGEHERTNSHD
ncbi:hypothetical protein MHAE_01605 [Mycobacterium haemophilum DSM 44634]|uniref:FAD-dependent oxidoreductase n=1 Tax=Mycobacterium haemophilum TaxID=29311 RepID=UPI0006550EA8|nr:FAD-dependent oxidoreductase [Mycobacterium haemophilum]AKN16977.1 FAD-dependent oxidoreductase [Mycobacterium haemophilum DSM 44634]